ncbi:major facilitator superfamily transporter [Colletotrichum scovillei]|uniref:Major facilitator superfamily transporter n=1 Tax=Colletotrichum scovillei TaxID=1209932 RepID=A0A9P7UD96_9PEZI|nr:major facilitator superfamily transporter [Colletotrichum scovillei]KAG7045946.1 major facilitator superfamily transporter [Colletotrichum scovillei]KAG7063291.1 major facilitator superfamily transporter [Colletotrichum scovillei]
MYRNPSVTVLLRPPDPTKPSSSSASLPTAQAASVLRFKWER